MERPRNSSGGRAQPLHPTPSTMGREFDRHHLPSWRPEPPFLPGRIAEPVEAPGARSGLPILQQSQAGAKQREVQGTADGSRGWAAHEPPLERCAELLGVDLATIYEAAANVEPYLRADGARIWPPSACRQRAITNGPQAVSNIENANPTPSPTTSPTPNPTPSPTTYCLVGKGRGPRQALTRKFEHTSPRSFTPPDSERGALPP